MIKLIGYSYKVQYRKERENKVVDALSRVLHSEKAMAITVVVPNWIIEVVQSYLGDEKCIELEDKLRIDGNYTPPYTLQNRIMRYKDRIYIGTSTDLKDQLLKSFHDSALGGHSGERATYQRMKLLFYWLGMKNEVNTFVKRCVVCQKTKSENIPYPGLLQPLPMPDMAWIHITLDFIKGLPKSEDKEVIMAVVNRFTKYAHFLS